MSISDEELVFQARDGNAKAFDQLVARHQERVFALAYRMLGNAEDAADIQQEAFVHAWTKLRSFRGEAAFTTWLYRVTVNACVSRKRRRSPSDSTEELDECRVITQQGARCQEQVLDRVMVRELLSSIEPKQRALLIMREVEGRSVEEIARITCSSLDTVRKRLWRARKLFRERLREYMSEDER